MNSKIQVRAVIDLAALQELECEWFQLWSRCQELSIFQSPDWLIPWVEAIAPSRLWVLEARRDGALVGLAPFFIYGTGGDRIVAPLGAGISDYLDVLLDPDVPGVLEALLRFVHEHASEWKQLHFPDLPGTSPLLDGKAQGEFALLGRNRASWRSGEFDCQLAACDFCPQLKLPASIDELRMLVPAKQLRNLRAARRQLHGAQVELADHATLDEFLAALFQLHEKRWRLNGDTGVLGDPRVRELYRRAAPCLLQRGMLRLFGLRHCGALVACLMAFFEQDVARLYMQGYDPDWARGSPGAQLIGAALEQAIQERKSTADFMRGREAYKYYWGSRDVPTYELRVISRRGAANIADKSAA